MIYSILTAIALFLLTGKVWAGIFGLCIGAVATGYFRRKAGAVIERKGGVEDARVLKQVSYNAEGKRPLPEDSEYTVLVKYKNGEKLRYILRGDTVMFRKLRPYFNN